MRKLRSLFVALLLLPAAGCSSLGYYGQAVNGQFEVYRKSRPVAEVIADPAADPALKEKLAAVQQVREYASRELGLPDNGSYRVYADLGRRYVLWNVFATPELSLEPLTWCFPVSGCVAYRGYFSREAAEAYAAELRAAGYDVHVGGVTAYSTLGWFSDPLLNTMIHRPLPEIAGLVFHELAHQQLYVRGDTTFSESFAMTVELEGVRRWLEANGNAGDYARYALALERREQFAALVLRYRDRLEGLYAADIGVAEKRAGKAQLLSALRAEYQQVRASWGDDRRYDGWFAREINNAHIASVGTYHHHVPAFQALLARHEGDMPAFYRAVAELGQLPVLERSAALNAFLPTATLAAEPETP